MPMILDQEKNPDRENTVKSTGLAVSTCHCALFALTVKEMLAEKIRLPSTEWILVLHERRQRDWKVYSSRWIARHMKLR